MKLKDFLKNTFGEDFLKELKKADDRFLAIYKPETNTVADIREIYIATQIVPRVILSFVFFNLKHLEENVAHFFKLPWTTAEGDVAYLLVTKLGPDNYSGQIETEKGKVLVKFNNKTIPAIALIILTSLELYNLHDIEQMIIAWPSKDKREEAEYQITDSFRLDDDKKDVLTEKDKEYIREKIQYIQDLINQCMTKQNFLEMELMRDRALRHMPYNNMFHMPPSAPHADVCSCNHEVSTDEEEYVKKLDYVTDKLKVFINEKLNSFLENVKDKYVEKSDKKDKDLVKNKIKNFIEDFKKKGFLVKSLPFNKSSSVVSCPDCETIIYKSEDDSARLCVCYGEFYNKPVKVFKSKSLDNTIFLKFPKNFGQENLQMFVDLWLKNNGDRYNG